MATIVDLMRHGEPVGGRRYRGQLDDPLSEEGWRQMRAAVADHAPWHSVVSSPLSRCAAFAGELAARHGLPLELEPRLKEISFGAWEGRTAQELTEADPQALLRFWSDPLRHTPPGGEGLPEFRDRVIPAWEALLDRHAGRHLLLVTHAGVMRMVLRHLLDMPLDRLFRFQVEYACVTRVVVDEERGMRLPRLLFHDGRL